MKLYCIGDVHGDLLVFLSALDRTGCVQNAQQVVDYVYDKKHRDGAFQAPALQWNPDFPQHDIVMMMGDVVDSKRGKDMPENIDDIEFSEEYMINTCAAFSRHPNFIHVIGNHEMACVVDSMDNEKYRSQYKCVNHKHKLPCRSHNKTQWKNLLKNHLINNCMPLLYRSFYVDNQCCNILFCHGGLENKFVEFLHTEYNSPYTMQDIGNREFWKETEKLCKTFYKEVLRNKAGRQQQYLSMPFTPDWSRIHRYDNVNDFPFFNIYVVGHSAEHMIRSKFLKSATNDQKTIKVFTDMQLSRVFNEEKKRDRYIFMFMPNLKRKVFENHKLNFDLLECASERKK